MSGVDVVVVAYRSAAHLRACVEPLAGLAGVAVVIVDNCCPDGSAATVADLPVTLVRSPTNAGFAAGCNLGVAASASPIVLLLNPDARIAPASLERLVELIESDPTIGIAAPRLVRGDGTVLPSLRRFPRVASTLAQAVGLHRALPRAAWADELERDAGAYGVRHDVAWASGAALAVRRRLLEHLDGLDERFFMYCEDMDLCWRTHAAGLRVVYEPAATVEHVGGGSGGGDALRPVYAASRIRYAQLHRSRTAAVLERAGVGLGAGVRVLLGLARRRPVRGHATALLQAATPVAGARRGAVG